MFVDIEWSCEWDGCHGEWPIEAEVLAWSQTSECHGNPATETGADVEIAPADLECPVCKVAADYDEVADRAINEAGLG